MIGWTRIRYTQKTKKIAPCADNLIYSENLAPQSRQIWAPVCGRIRSTSPLSLGWNRPQRSVVACSRNLCFATYPVIQQSTLEFLSCNDQVAPCIFG